MTESSTVSPSVQLGGETTLMPEVRNISNSEVSVFLACKRMYNFAFWHNLAPKSLSTPLARGSIGHLFFQRYVEARLAGHSHDESMRHANDVATKEAMAEYPVDVVMNAQFLWLRYMNFHQGWPQWKLLGTEVRHALPITETLNFPIRYDLYFEELTTGKFVLLDFKFTYDFWSPGDHDINAQMPKYISVMRANGIRVDKGYIEEIRTRPLGAEKSGDPKNLWKRTPYSPTPARFRTMMKQHVSTALLIERHRNLTPQQREDESIPVFNKHGACKSCNFKDLCNSMTEGKTDLSVEIRTDYIQNDYAVQQQIMDDII